jgi:aryl-alcohol dehydrogenase-like predicted oxidoreductase
MSRTRETRAKNILRAIERSMRRFRTDYIDHDLIRAWDKMNPLEEVADPG